MKWVCKLMDGQRPSILQREQKTLVSALHCTFRECPHTRTATDVHYIMILWSTIVRVRTLFLGWSYPSDGRLDTPQAVEDRCICSSLHIYGNSVDVCYYHRCPVHSDTAEHNCMHTNIVTRHANFVRLGELPETNNMPQPVGDACICSTLHIQGKVVQKYYKRCPVHNDTE